MWIRSNGSGDGGHNLRAGGVGCRVGGGLRRCVPKRRPAVPRVIPPSSGIDLVMPRLMARPPLHSIRECGEVNLKAGPDLSDLRGLLVEGTPGGR